MSESETRRGQPGESADQARWQIGNPGSFRRSYLCCCLVAGSLFSTFGGENTTAAAAPIFFRMGQLDEAKKRAAAEARPIAWIASYPEYLEPHSNLMGNGSHAGTAYAIRALQNETVLVFSDARTENHQEPSLVDSALHSPGPLYTVPGVIILTPSLDKVICKAPFTSDPQQRIKIFTEALKQIRDKDSWGGKAPSK